MKTAIIIFSDPKSGSEEALGRVFNAMAAAYDYQQNGEEVTIQFQGAGSRWIEELGKPDHPANGLFDAVKDNIRGVSCGCADVFGATEEVENAGFDLIKDNPVPGTAGVAGLRSLVNDGYTVLTF
ncbi:MAG: hypothetical protein EP297_00875 [Gammaproteobacteria bacterium]|nr:MAG: hypothetical protein EP297_00875 [Gammaproteobacteria bacterium]UCC57379.1 MAG: DsrE family protein [Gammaproteobacteria bacterium]